MQFAATQKVHLHPGKMTGPLFFFLFFLINQIFLHKRNCTIAANQHVHKSMAEPQGSFLTLQMYLNVPER